MADQADAQRRVNQIRAFRAELAALEAAGVSPLSSEQEAVLASYHDNLLRRLSAQYDVDRSERAGQLSRGMRLLSFFGAAALTAAIYALVARFWGRLDLPLQATVLAAFPLMALVGVELTARRERTLYFASLFALVAYGTFWLAIGELCRLLNIPFTPVWLWAGALFGVALAVPYGFRIILAVALAALAAATVGSVFQAAGIVWTQAFERLELLTAAGFSLLLVSVPLMYQQPAFAPIVRLVSLGIGLAGLLVLSEWSGATLLPLDGGTAQLIYHGLMLATCVSVLVVSVRQGWSETVYLTSVILALFLAARFFDWFWELLPGYVFFLLLAAIAFVWLYVLRRIRARLEAVP